MELVLSHQEQMQQHQMLEHVHNFHNAQMLIQIKQPVIPDLMPASLTHQP